MKFCKIADKYQQRNVIVIEEENFIILQIYIINI